jgi:hypothetical protein
MTITNQEPDEASVRASVERVENDVLRGIRTNRVRKRRLTIGFAVLAGAGLLAGGIVVGGAALVPSPNPGANDGVTLDSHGHVLTSLFAVDCYSSISAKTPDFSQTDNRTSVGSAAVARNPAATCGRMSTEVDTQSALDKEVDALFAAGKTHGYIRVVGGNVWHFERENGPKGTGVGWSLDDGVETQRKGLAVTATITVPSASEEPMAVCAVASNWTAVYPRGSESAAEVCSGLGYQVWDQ